MPKHGITTLDALVVGAGAYGASVAYHLADAGLSVGLTDRRPFVTETSPRAAGLAVQVRTLEEFGQAAMRSVELLVNFEERTGESLLVSQTGSVAIARDEPAEKRVREHPDLGTRYGLEVQLIDAGVAAGLAPYADYEKARAISYTPTDLHLEPGDLPRAYIQAAERRGLTRLEGHDVRSLIRESGRVLGVRTDRGEVRADFVVACTGGWLSSLALDVGLQLPVQPVRHQLVVSEPTAEVTDSHSSVRVVDANVYARPYANGIMFGGYESAPVFMAGEELPGTVADLDLDMTALDELRGRVHAELPLLERVGVRELRGGVPTLTADGYPIIDEIPGTSGFFVVGGCNVGGLSTSPAMGEALAGWIATGQRPQMLTPFSLDRFQGQDTATLAGAARERYTATELG